METHRLIAAIAAVIFTATAAFPQASVRVNNSTGVVNYPSNFVSANSGTTGSTFASGTDPRITTAAQKTITLFVLAGQSNSYGAGGSTASAPTPNTSAYQWTSTGGVQSLTLTSGTTGGQTLGTSLVPQFANTYYGATGNDACYIIGVGIDGAAQTAAADTGTGNFDTSGALRATVVSRTASAKSALEALGYKVRHGGIIWVQGEADGIAIAASTISQATYRTALQTMVAYYRTNIAADLPFYIVRTGWRTNVTNAGNFSVWTAQEQVAQQDKSVLIVSRNSTDFPALGYMADTVHYNQSGQNFIGKIAAMAVASNQSPPDGMPGGGSPVLAVSATTDNQVVTVTGATYLRITSDNSTATNRSIVLTPPIREGHVLTIENVGSNNIEVVNGGTLSSSPINATVFLSGTDWRSTQTKSSLTLTSDGVNWIEQSRAR